MCAINGFTFNDSSLLKKMMNYCKNRGPDWEEAYYDQNISLGHNRLSILDIENRSNQPFIYGGPCWLRSNYPCNVNAVLYY